MARGDKGKVDESKCNHPERRTLPVPWYKTKKYCLKCHKFVLKRSAN